MGARGEAEAFADAQKHPAYKYFPETKEEQFASLAAAPLKVAQAAAKTPAVK